VNKKIQTKGREGEGAQQHSELSRRRT